MSPQGSLDEENKQVVIDLMLVLRECGKTLVIATHDADIIGFASLSLLLWSSSKRLTPCTTEKMVKTPTKRQMKYFCIASLYIVVEIFCISTTSFCYSYAPTWDNETVQLRVPFFPP